MDGMKEPVRLSFDGGYKQHESVSLIGLDELESEIREDVERPKTYSEIIEEEQTKLRQP